MRAFSEKEKNLIRKVITGDSFYFRDFFSDFFLENVKAKVPLSSPEKINKIKHSKRIEFRQIAAELMTSIKLIHLLETNGWIYGFKVEVPLKHSQDLGTFEGEVEDEIEMERFSFVADHLIREELGKNIQMEYVIMEPLKIFVSNNFKTTEDLHTENNYRISRVSLRILWISTLIALVGMIYNIYEGVKAHNEINVRINRTNDTVQKIHQNQFIILKAIDGIKKDQRKTDSLLNTLIKATPR